MTSIRRLYELFDLVSGKLIRKVTTNPRASAGTTAGDKPDSKGYGQVQIDGKKYQTHRLVFAMHYGWWPHQVDHKNLNTMDNRPDNLRAASSTDNVCNRRMQVNNKVGVKGLSFSRNLWRGVIRYERATYSKTSKHRAVVEAWLINKRNELHGAFARHN